MNTTTYRSRGRHRPPKVVRELGRWRRFARACSAIALGCGGALAGLVAYALLSYNLAGPTVVAELAVLGVVLLLAAWALALDPGEAWQLLTRSAQPLTLTEKTHV